MNPYFIVRTSTTGAQVSDFTGIWVWAEEADA